jgi:hypothetical protein
VRRCKSNALPHRARPLVARFVASSKCTQSGATTDQKRREKMCCPTLEEEKGTREERSSVMSSIMKPPAPESSAPPYPKYAPFPGYTQPPRRSHRWVWITVGIVALFCIVGGALLVWGASQVFTTYYNSAYRASDMYYSAIKHQDYSQAYSYLGSHLQSEYSLQAFTQAAQQQDAVAGTVSSYNMPNFPTGEPASITLTVTRANGTTYDVHLVLQQEGGGWKVTAFDRF